MLYLYMSFEIIYFNSVVEKNILKLPYDLLARYLRLTDLMIEFGPNLGMPHTKAMKDGLFELRLKSKEGIARVLYCTIVKSRVVILHSFMKKSNKTPQKELKTAIKRMKEVKNES